MTEGTARLMVDGHVHFHPCFSWKVFLQGAAVNFARARRALGLPLDSAACLMFTESAGVDSFRELLEAPGMARALGWHLSTTDDDCALVLRRQEREALIIVAGRQIVTAENVEVLALGCRDQFPDRRPLRDVLRAVAAAGVVAVIPWGFGKWLGRRGRIVRSLIESDSRVPFCLGDNGGRARVMPRPTMFDVAAKHGVPVLGGSDPLPLPSHATRAGSYGFVLDAWRDSPRPASAINERLRALMHSPASFGELSSVSAMVRSQIGIRWRRHRSAALRDSGQATCAF